MKRILLAALVMVATMVQAAEPLEVMSAGRIDIQPGDCNTVYIATKAIASNATDDYEFTQTLNPSELGDTFARIHVIPIAAMDDTDRKTDNNQRIVRAALFLRKNMATILGDVTRYHDAKMKPEDIRVNVAQSMHSMCSKQKAFYSEALYTN